MSLLQWVLILALCIAVYSQGDADSVTVSTESELVAAVRDAQSGQTIRVAASRLVLPSSLTLTAPNVVLRGDVDGATLVCPDSTAALFISSRDVEVVDLGFEGCRVEPAVVIEGRGQRSVNAVLRGVRFEDNHLRPSNGSYLLGLPNPSTAPLLIRRCRLTPCRTNVSVTLEQATFVDNSADQGGAVFARGADLTIRDSVFRRNSARLNGGAVFVLGIRSVVEIASSRFEENRVTQSGTIRRVDGASNGQPLEIVAYWSFAMPSATGGAIDIDSVSSVSILDSNFSSNLAPAGGAVAVTLDRNPLSIANRPPLYSAQLSGCHFEDNHADYTQQLYRRGIALTSSYRSGGAIYIISNAPEFRLTIEDSRFLRNTARFGGALHVVTNMETAPRIFQTLFSENRASESGGAILLRNTGRMEFRASNCTGNTALLGGCILMTNNAQLQIEGPAGFPPNRQGISCYFMNNSAVNGGALMCAACGDAVLREPYFINNTAVRNGGAVYVLETDVTFSIEQNIFQSNRAFAGGGVAIQSAGDVRIRGNVGLISQFRDNRAVSGGGLHASASSQRENRFEMEDTVFESNEAITVEEALEDDVFRTAVEELLADESRNSPSNATAELTSWRSACGVAGGGAFCLNLRSVPNGAVAEYHVSDTLFEQNRAVMGGGVYVAVEQDGQWNQAEREGGTCPATRLYDPCRSFRFVNVTITENVASAGAGGVFITEPEALALQCRLQSNDSTTLMAAMQDGVVDEADEVCNMILGNAVDEGGFGPDGGTSAHKLRIPPASRTIVNHTSGERLLPNCPECPDNTTVGLEVQVLDAFGEVITGGIPGSELAINLVSNRILGERRYTAERGIVNVNNTLGMGIGISESVIRVEAVRTPSLRSEIEFSTRSCFPGEEESFVTCERCRPLEYAFDPAPPGCIQCEDHAVCTGGAALVPVEGFWHSTPFSPQFHECIVKDACRYDNRVEVLSAYYYDLAHIEQVLRDLNATLLAGGTPSFPEYLQCAKGYSGILCGSCKPGYGHFPGGECVECPTGKSGSILISILISLWMTFFVGANIVTTFSSTNRQVRLAVYKRDATVKQSQPQSRALREPSVPMEGHPDEEENLSDNMDDRITAMIKMTETLKILVNYLQVTSVALSINLNWIGLIEGLLSVELMLIGVTSGSSYFVPLDCTFDEEDPEDPDGTPNSIKVLWLRATFPLILLSFFIIISCIYAFRAQRKDRRHDSNEGVHSFTTVKSYCIVVVIVVVFFSYISITSEFMRTINCVHVDEDSTGHQYEQYAIETGDRVWAEDTSLYCFQGDHTVTGVFGIVGLIVFSLGVIAFILAWLPYNASRLDDPAFIAEYGFIYQGYREKWYTIPWYSPRQCGTGLRVLCREAAIAIRKALIATAVVYAFPLGPNLQGVCAMGVIILSIAVHFVFLPFKSFKGHPNVPHYAGQLLRAFKLGHMADEWVRINNHISLNALEAASLLFSLIVFYAGILFNDENTTTAGRYTMAVFTFIVNVGFIVYVLYRLYYGAHVAANLYCEYLRSLQPSQSIPEGHSMFALAWKGITIYRNRHILRNSNAHSRPASDIPFEERI